MKYKKIANSDIEVSQICCGCMSFGKRGTMNNWSLEEDDASKIIKHCLDLGINFFDTSNNYSSGTSEEILGNAIKKYTTRDKVIIASKVYFNDGHLSKSAITREIEGTLNRLQTSYLDIYYIHRFDYSTSPLETLSALHSLVKEGKVRLLGASSMWGYQFLNYLNLAKEKNLTSFSLMQNQYNLLYREEEREMIPICKENNIALIPFSPLAMGRLSRSGWSSSSLRFQDDKIAKAKYDIHKDEDIKIVERVDNLSKKYNVSMSTIALAWLFKKGVTSPIIGATKKSHYDDAIKSLDIDLTNDEVNYLEELYYPHPVTSVLKN